MADAETVARIIRLNGGKLIGKTRLQKSAYFLEALGVGFELDFTYHHYGPYSEELEYLANDARALDLVDIDWRRSSEGAKYAIYLDRSGDLPKDSKDARRVEALKILGQYSSTELELAATADFLARSGYGDDAWEETERRKFSKTSPDWVARAQELLKRLEAGGRGD
jgi:uncharacterized protein YwgA